MDPLGFVNEKDSKNYHMDNNENPKTTEKSSQSSDKEQEYGFKIKGPEPTRFGDWERKGRCTDF